MTKFLPSILVAGLLVCQTQVCRAADNTDATAYTALRSMGNSLGADALSHVVEMTGRRGTPQPATWRIVVAEGGKGTREVRVAGARIVSQKTSSQVSSLKPIRLEDLNLDSSGAFEAANTEARKSHVPFAALNYSLQVPDGSNKPVWDLQLVNDGGVHVGTVQVAAHDGKLVSVSGLPPGQPTQARSLVSAGGDHDSVQPTRVAPLRTTTTTTTTAYESARTGPPPPRTVETDRREVASAPPDDGGFFSRAGRTLDHTTDAVGNSVSRTGQAVDRTMRRTGTKLQRFFTGHDDRDGDTVRPN